MASGPGIGHGTMCWTSGRGAYLSREKEDFLRWPHVADAIQGMILLGQWLDPEERPLPSEAEQITFIEQAEREKREVFTLPQGGHRLCPVRAAAECPREISHL